MSRVTVRRIVRGRDRLRLVEWEDPPGVPRFTVVRGRALARAIARQIANTTRV